MHTNRLDRPIHAISLKPHHLLVAVAQYVLGETAVVSAATNTANTTTPTGRCSRVPSSTRPNPAPPDPIRQAIGLPIQAIFNLASVL